MMHFGVRHLQLASDPGVFPLRWLTGIRARLLLLVALCTLPAFGILFYDAWDDSNKQIEQAREELRLGARRSAAELDSHIRGAELLLRSLARVPEIRGLEAPACSRLLAELIAPLKRYATAGVARPDGEVVCNAVAITGRSNIAGRDYYQQALASHGIALGVPVLGRVSNKVVLPVALALRDSSNRVVAVLVAAIDLEWFARLEASEWTHPGTALVLWDREARVLFKWPNPAQWVGKTFGDTPLGKAILAQPSGAFSAPGTDGVDRVLGFARLDETGEQRLKLNISVSTDVLLEAPHAALSRNITVLALLTLLVFGIAWALGDVLIRRRLAALARAAERMGAGDLGARVGAPYKRDELGDMARSFDAMAGRIQAQREDLRKFNTELEQRVVERTAQLEASNKELESFSYSVSHDLRSPLRAIDGFARILEEDYGGKLDDEGRRLFRVVRDNSRKMGQLIDDLLEFSRLGRKPLSTTEVDMKRLVEQAFGELRTPDERPPGLAIEALPPARGDAVLLKQAWANLLGNAIKFSGKREAPVIEVTGHENGAENVYCVKDNGAGFDMRYYDKLFGVFQRLHSSAEFPGTGVGLAIVQRVVSRHGGRVWAEGKVGEGATFYFSLPKGEQDGRI